MNRLRRRKKEVANVGFRSSTEWMGGSSAIGPVAALRVYMGSNSINMLNEDLARLPRYFVKGVPLHITLRGNNRNPIFGNDDDYQFFKECLLDEYSWASYRCNAEGRADALVSPHSYYRGLAREEIERLAAYRILVKCPMDVQTIDTIRTCTNKGWALGSQKFQSKIEPLAERRAAPVSKGRPKSITAD